MGYMTSRFKGRCTKCRVALPVGTRIYHDKPNRKTYCTMCWEAKLPDYPAHTPTYTDTPPVRDYGSTVETKRPDMSDEARFDMGHYSLPEIIDMTERVLRNDMSMLSRAQNRTNIGKALDYCKGDDNEWSGLSPGQLADYLSGRKVHEDRKLYPNAEFTYQSVGTTHRERVWDSDEGELLDWEHLSRNRSLRHRRRRTLPVKALEIDVHVATSNYVSHRHIDEMGEYIFGAIRGIEAGGVCVGLTVCSYTTAADASYSRNVGIRVRVKEPTEFLSPSVMRSVISAAFMRQHTFVGMAHTMDRLKATVSSTFGAPARLGLKVMPGYLRIGVGDSRDLDTDRGVIKSAINEALGIA